MPSSRALFVGALLWLATSASKAATYYLDAGSGDDSHSGVSEAQAWKTLDRVNQAVFQPGDKMLLKAGTRYTGQLKPQGSGKLIGNQPQCIVLGKYGAGPMPRIDGEGLHTDTLLLQNIAYWEVENLEITNLGTNREPWRTGVRVVADGFGTMSHIHLRELYVHDVNGDLRKSQEGCGIFFETRGGNGSRFDDLLIENCRVVRTDRNGICERTRGGPRSTGVIIRRNMIEDIGGDGIKLWGSNGGLVEHNLVRGGAQRCTDAAAGIWPFDSDDTLIQFNEVSGMKGTIDSQGFDSDYRCRRSVFQYNYSHDNEGGFILICTPGNSWCGDTVIRYNISQNDGTTPTGVFHFGGGATNTWVYNNDIYIGPKQDLALLSFTEWSGGNARDTHFCNNIFYVEGRVRYRWGKSADNVFEHNAFYGNHASLPEDPHAITNQPPLANPGSGANGFGSLAGYRLTKSAALASGFLITNNGGRDFFGNPVPRDKPPSIGACEAVAP